MPNPPTGASERARELLAEAFEAEGIKCGIILTTAGKPAATKDRAAIRAITKAISETEATARAAAIEEAARVAEARVIPQDGYEPESAWDSGRYSAAKEILDAIRSLSSRGEQPDAEGSQS